MHNKLFIADGAIVVAGGRNVADEYFMRSMGANFVDMDAFIVGAVVPQFASIFDTYWNSPYVYPVQTIIDVGVDRAQLRERFNQLVDDGDQMMSLVLPPIDVLGYGAISDDLESGRLGLIWAPAVAFADPPAKVTARTDEAGARDECCDECDGARDRRRQRSRDLVAVSDPRVEGRRSVRRSGQAQRQSHDPDQFARGHRRAAGAYGLLALSRGDAGMRASICTN